ncbi:MAG TPA: uroporphyrinogen-III C-methyltransferase [Micromonosporaceae bacterium]|nr:uroporphyrinogen-III C-methyltransferase [Micromonosporaceae bacterium]
MNLYPLALRLDGRMVLVVGGGTVATRRVPALLDAGADVVVVSPSLTPALRALADAGRVRWVARRFEPSDVDGVWLVQVAVDDPAAASAVSDAAEARRIFCVRADDRHAATAWTPAVTRHGPVTVAVLGGGDPRLSMAVRDRIRSLLSDRPDAAVPTGPGGVVALVGAGPGDPELITVKGRRLLAEADVVVADRLTPGLLLDELRADAELVDASKIPYGPAATQEEINRILVERARAGLRVVRLKGGDPFVFGRGGEEVAACTAAGIPVTVVPGVTSAVAAPAMAGIPVTHRGVAHEFVVVSGHVAPGDPASLVDWSALARLRGTVCVLMGLANLPAIVAALMTYGRDPGTPAAVIQDGTTGAQRVVRAPLHALAETAASEGIQPPAVVVIGDLAAGIPETPG